MHISKPIKGTILKCNTKTGSTQGSGAQAKPGKKGWTCWVQGLQFSSLFLNSPVIMISPRSPHSAPGLFSYDSFHFSSGA